MIKSNFGTKTYFLVLWVIISLIVAAHHEIWRDEMRALSIVIENSSIWNLIHDLKNEGHPMLWYLLLKMGYFVFPNAIVLKIISWLIGLATVLLLFRYVRLPIWLVVSYAFSQILLWENTIMCRNYGISSLLIFIFLYFYRASSFIGIVLSLALLIQTNALSVPISWLLLVIAGYHMKIENKWNKKHIVFSSLVLGCSTILFYITTQPDSTSIVGRVKDYELGFLVEAGLKSFLYPSQVFRSIIGESAIMNILLVIGLTICLVHRKYLMGSFWIIIAITQFVNIEVYNLFTRHLGIVFTFFIVLLDLGGVYNLPKASSTVQRFQSFSKYIFVPILFFAFNVSAALNLWNDLNNPISSNKDLAQFINKNNQYEKSVIIGDADFIIEGLSYYLHNPIYILRENKFGKYIQFTTRNRNALSISELVDIGTKFSNETNCPTLFVCNQKFNPVKDTLYKYPCYTQLKVMLFDSSSLVRLHKVKDFYESYEDENYTLYELR
jgi:hypothetical protein